MDKKSILYTVGAVVLVLLIVFLVGRNGNGDNLKADVSSNLSNTTSTESMLTIEDVVMGEGEAVKAGDTVSVHYTGTLEDGTKFDSSLDRGTPFEFTVGAGQVIKGWDEGLLGMKVGGKRKLVLPPELAYGAFSPSPLIPANSTLLFEIELLAITVPGKG